jgi:hypothetical protein
MMGAIEKNARKDVSTRLAFDHTRDAYDRTMMAWIDGDVADHVRVHDL